tara:strand:+ start:255 stop:965 length:711 start_codon:yes stop_codon:yes gene_type:complete
MLSSSLPSIRKHSDFIIEDVIDDDACFYRALANQLFYLSYYHKSIVILSKNNKLVTKKITQVLGNTLWSYQGYEQTKMAKVLQQRARNYIYKNKDIMIDDLGITAQELAIHTHNISSVEQDYNGWELIEIYNELYKTFAGDDKQPSDFIPWGGASEQWALSEYLKMPIIVYMLHHYNKNKNKIYQGRIYKNTAARNSYFKPIQIFGLKYTNTSPSINLLFKKTKKGPHYLSLYEKV